MGSQESKRVENTGEVINEIITSPSVYSVDNSVKIMLMIITGIVVFEFVWKLHNAYRGNLKKRYKSSATLAEI